MSFETTNYKLKRSVTNDDVEQTIADVSSNFETIDSKMKEIDDRSSLNKSDVASLTTRMTTAETKNSDQDTRLTNVEGRATSLEGRATTNETNITTNASNLTTHKTSSDHDGRYYPKTDVDTKLATKTDKLGDHLGTWHGLLPSQANESIASQVQANTDQIGNLSIIVPPSNGVDDTTTIQNVINNAPEGSIILLRDKHYISSITINKPLYIYGAYKTGSTFGVQGTGGTILKGISQTQDMIKIDASAMPVNRGLSVSMERLTIIGNSDVAGATSGAGINLTADKNGETFFIESCYFKDVHIRDTKGSGWVITGTCFSNEWYSCSTLNTGEHGLKHDKGTGNPGNNNFYNCKFWNSINFGFHSDGGKCTLYACNISQNAGGGLYQRGGYMILSDCDFEENTGVQIDLHSSSPATRISGGMIHKSPGHVAATGIALDNLCLGISVTDVLFANYDHVNDRLFTSAGGSFGKFEVRQQNCLASALPQSNWGYIEDKNFKRKIQTGNISFTGSGAGIRTQTITFPTSFEQSYIVVLTVDGNGIDPDKVAVSVDYSTQGFGSIVAKVNVLDAGYGGINVKYIAIGV